MTTGTDLLATTATMPTVSFPPPSMAAAIVEQARRPSRMLVWLSWPTLMAMMTTLAMVWFDIGSGPARAAVVLSGAVLSSLAMIVIGPRLPRLLLTRELTAAGVPRAIAQRIAADVTSLPPPRDARLTNVAAIKIQQTAALEHALAAETGVR